jgi:hypothetical protein
MSDLDSMYKSGGERSENDKEEGVESSVKKEEDEFEACPFSQD